MNKEYAKKKVVTSDEQHVGIIVEEKDGDLIARSYYKNEFKTYIAEEKFYPLDVIKVQKMRTEVSKVREISRQLGTGHYVISEDAIPLISKIA